MFIFDKRKNWCCGFFGGFLWSSPDECSLEKSEGRAPQTDCFFPKEGKFFSIFLALGPSHLPVTISDHGWVKVIRDYLVLQCHYWNKRRSGTTIAEGVFFVSILQLAVHPTNCCCWEKVGVYPDARNISGFGFTCYFSVFTILYTCKPHVPYIGHPELTLVPIVVVSCY